MGFRLDSPPGRFATRSPRTSAYGFRPEAPIRREQTGQMM